jgi:signal transduction histidine kinase
MRPRLLTEMLTSLALVMLCASVLLAALLAAQRERDVRDLLVRGLAIEALQPERGVLAPGTRWFEFSADGHARARVGRGDGPDDETRSLAEEARRDASTLLRVGDDGLRFAVPMGIDGRVAAAFVPAESMPAGVGRPEAVALLLALANAVVFTAFGAWIFHRRIVSPLRRLSGATRAFAEGASDARAPVDGTGEVAEVAEAFNTMAAALEARTGALEKAVGDLREANHSLRMAEEGLARSERLAAVGRLAAGVAHEVGNPMGALLGFLDAVSRDPGLGAGGRSALERAATQAERVRTILRQLLDFSRPVTQAPEPVDVAHVASETLGLVRAQRRYAGIDVSVVVEPHTPLAFVDPGALGQILLNLVLNAADAVRGRPDGSGIRIDVERGVRFARRDDTAASGLLRGSPDAVVCRVEDDGPGIAPEDRERIFDPFFTTKAPGEGTGLGLANAVRLTEQQGGSLDLVAARALRGAAFELRLPVAGQPTEVRDAAHVRSARDCAVRTPMRAGSRDGDRQR